ncbi:MAG: iron-containing alcohol dehydrogenase [Actinomycetales bacterium]|nr:iron-containing alcohol dehydrogenase [Actinomycetales bacterium]
MQLRTDQQADVIGEPFDTKHADVIGEPFDTVHADAIEVLADLGPTAIIAANDPPWAAISTALADRGITGLGVVLATSMEEADLAQLAAAQDEAIERGATCVIGVGGGTAIDTAKYLAWARGLPAVYIPTIASVDATFTDAVGIRRDRRVAYIGQVRPREVVIDLPLITSAPPRLNRGGIGDILSCHTGLFDWRLAADAGLGAPWDERLAALGRTLLDELEAASADIHAASAAGVGFLLDAYRRIGAACAAAGHSRFEEGSEHFLGYALEEVTGEHYVHGELISMCVVAMSTIQGNDPERAARIIRAAGTSAHPSSLGLDQPTVVGALMGLGAYVKAEGLDDCIATMATISEPTAQAAWAAIDALPGHARSAS